MDDEELADSEDALSAKDAGIIAGKLGYPGEVVPKLHVYAISTSTGKHYRINTTPGKASYEILVPKGQYHIAAYSEFNPAVKGGFTQYVQCGLKDVPALRSSWAEGSTCLAATPITWSAEESPIVPTTS